jgi:hypothetical protein
VSDEVREQREVQRARANEAVRLAADLSDRLSKIAEWHRLDVDGHGGNTGTCGECGLPWPCATYRWATDDTAEPNCTWDLDECEIHNHKAVTE